MNNVLTTPIGLDKAIQNVQVDLYNALIEKWDGDIDGYGRVEKTPMNTGDTIPEYYETSKIVIPEWYNASKKGYEEVYYDDKKSCVFCFAIQDEDKTLDQQVFTCKVKCVFMVDLSKIYPASEERMSSKAQKEAVEILRDLSYGEFKITGIERRIEIIWRGYKTSHITHDDMHPLHMFAVLFDLNYYTETSC